MVVPNSKVKAKHKINTDTYTLYIANSRDSIRDKTTPGKITIQASRGSYTHPQGSYYDRQGFPCKVTDNLCITLIVDPPGQ